jgi:hypothetical protein
VHGTYAARSRRRGSGLGFDPLCVRPAWARQRCSGSSQVAHARQGSPSTRKAVHRRRSMASGPYTSCSSFGAAATRHALSGNSAPREAPVARLLRRGRPAKVAAPVVESVTVDVVHAHAAARRRSHEELMQPSTEVRAAGGAAGVGGALAGLCHPLERFNEGEVRGVDDGEPWRSLRPVEGKQRGPVAEVDGPPTPGSALAARAIPRLCESDSSACLARMRYADADDGSSVPNPGTRPLRRRSSAPAHPAHLAWAPHTPITFQPSSGHSSPYRSPRFLSG